MPNPQSSAGKPDWQGARGQKFPSDLIHAAQAADRATGVPACLILAQWAWESAWGTRLTGSYNYFGEKWAPGCGFTYKAVGTHEEENGKMVFYDANSPKSQKFINFPSMEAAFAYQGKHLATSQHYVKAQSFLRKDWRKFIEAIDGIYASDHNYVAGIMSVIEQYHLYDYNVSYS